MPNKDLQLAYASIRRLGAGLRDGELTSVELTEFFLERLERLGAEYNCVVSVTRKRALENAKQADRDLANGLDHGPLHGIPYGVKDLLATRGYPTSWGAAPYRDRVIENDATAVRRLDDAGAVLCAKLSMVTFAGGFGYSSATCTFSGPQLNPWDKRRFSGGSSTGPGAAVGGGMVPFAIGSETNGSIITPAAFCGIAGFRPTYGRVSRYGAMPLSFTLDKLGPMCRTADDCGLVLAALVGPDENDPSAVNVPFDYQPSGLDGTPIRIGLLKDSAEKLQTGVDENFSVALDVLREFSTIEEVDLPDLPYRTVVNTVLSCEKAAAFEPLLESGEFHDLTDPATRLGAPFAEQLIPAKDYIRAMQIRREIQQQLHRFMEPFDAIVTPTHGFVAYPADIPFREYKGRDGVRYRNMGSAANLAGLPGISIPNGFGEDHMPTGLNLVGRVFEEDRLLAVANEYQKRTTWHEQHPSI